MSVPAPDRKESKAEFIKVGGEIVGETLKLYGRQCYADIKDSLMIEIYHLASRMMECLIRANDIYTPNTKDKATIEYITIPKQQERVRLFVEAKGNLAALSNKITELYTVRPVKHKYRGQKKRIGELLDKEYSLVKGMVSSEENKLKKLIAEVRK